MSEFFFKKESSFVPVVSPPQDFHDPSFWFIFREREMLVTSDGCGIPLVSRPESLSLTPDGVLYVGRLSNIHCFAASMPVSYSPPPSYRIVALRDAYGKLEEDLFWAAGRAAQLLDWDRDHRFCGRCGVQTQRRVAERARECPRCGILFFPRLSPAVIVLVRKKDQILLARPHRLPAGVFSLVAGFVEPGESLEQAAIREVREEVGVAIENLSYFASQPWPFPNSLMMGFFADYASGEIKIDPTEIAEAGWFRWDRMPSIPGPLSLSRHLIEKYLSAHGVST